MTSSRLDYSAISPETELLEHKFDYLCIRTFATKVPTNNQKRWKKCSLMNLKINGTQLNWTELIIIIQCVSWVVKRGFATRVFQWLIGSSQPELRNKKKCLWMCVLFFSSFFCISAFAYTFKYNSGLWCAFGRTARRATRPEWIYSQGVLLRAQGGRQRKDFRVV
jgi:hypothetical protein